MEMKDIDSKNTDFQRILTEQMNEMTDEEKNIILLLGSHGKQVNKIMDRFAQEDNVQNLMLSWNLHGEEERIKLEKLWELISNFKPMYFQVFCRKFKTTPEKFSETMIKLSNMVYEVALEIQNKQDEWPNNESEFAGIIYRKNREKQPFKQRDLTDEEVAILKNRRKNGY